MDLDARSIVESIPRMHRSLRTLVVIGLAVALLAWFLRNADLAGVGRELSHGRWDLLLLAIGTTITTYTIRSIRWQYLLAGLGPTRFSNAFRATVIGFAASFLLPARAGEFLRPYLLARHESLSATAAFATVILERIFDMATVLLFFGAFLLWAGPEVQQANPGLFAAVKMGGLMATGATAVALVACFLMAGKPAALDRVSRRIEAVLPRRIAHLASGLLHTFAEGLAAVRRPQQLVMVMLWSIPLWFSIACGIWFVSLAFGIDLPLTGAYLLMTLLVGGVAVPTPGAVGGFHEAYRIGVTAFYLVPNDRAVGAAIVLHAISFVPVTILGIVFMAQEGLTLGRMRRLAEERAGAKEEAR